MNYLVRNFLDGTALGIGGAAQAGPQPIGKDGTPVKPGGAVAEMGFGAYMALLRRFSTLLGP
ncbi:MAG: hypothetical protein B0D92_02370 [Spirochaeta sp. LUC14_002_19_P3]|nr:MAG: hypothetical protein B0D92_02370 [Spirochaeta sp. LUC14_002_19_P3]